MKIEVRKDSGSFAWLIVGIVLLLFSNGKWIIPIAAWAGPVFMARFLRTQNVLQGLLITNPIIYHCYRFHPSRGSTE